MAGLRTADAVSKIRHMKMPDVSMFSQAVACIMLALPVAGQGEGCSRDSAVPRWDGGRLLVECGPNKALRVKDNVDWLERGLVPGYAVGNVIRWLEFNGVDCAKYRAKYRPEEPSLGLPLAQRKGFRLGYMLDISRDKVPKLATLKRIVDALSFCGFNEFQLYTEVVFAYKNHPEMWQGWSPLTAEDIRELDDYAWSKGVTLTPNQNSFGHLEKMFRHKKYLPLAETPNGFDIEHPPLHNRPPAALAASAPESLAFLGGLYDELFPLFRHADRVNVGCDEVWDIFDKNARSAAKARRVGVSRVYLDHLRDVNALCAARGFRMEFWADMMLWSFDLLDEMPKGAMPIVWGYSGETSRYPGYTCEFEGRCLAMSRRGFNFYVGPSVNVYGGYFCRHETMRGNVDLVVAAARKYGACGLLLTDWGDGGHRAPWLSSLPGLFYTAAKVRGEELSDAELARRVDAYLGVTVGETLVALGHVNERATSAAEVAKARAALEKVDLKGAPEWVANAFETYRLGTDIMESKLKGDFAVRRAEFASRFRACWLKDNREGGLDESLRKENRLID